MGEPTGADATPCARPGSRGRDRGRGRQRLNARPLYSEPLAAAVLRPLAQQLLEEVDVTPGSIVCELMCDSGVLSHEVARRLGASGTLIVTDTELGRAQQVAGETGGICTTVAARLEETRIPVDDSSCDEVLSLIGLPVADPGTLLEDSLRALRPRGVLAVVVWNTRECAPYESALLSTLEEHGLHLPQVERLLSPIDAPAWTRSSMLRDTARLQTFGHLWAAMRERLDDAGLSAEQLAAVRDGYARRMSRYEAADGTITMPLSAALIRGEAPP